MSKKPVISIRITHGALDERQDSPVSIILRGVVEPTSLNHLRVAAYQREAQPLSSQRSVLEALQNGHPLPDIELGMRGQNFSEVNGVFVLNDPIYIIDGLQRVTSAIHYLNGNPGTPPRLGATVHFNTTEEWERNRFHALNTSRLRVSPSVLLRNQRTESPAIGALFGLSVNDKSFPLYERVSWSQRMNKGELISGLTLCKVVGLLVSHKVASKRNNGDDLVPALDKAADVFGLQILRDNTKTFFGLIDECWGIKRVQYRSGAAYMRGTFLLVLARILADHRDFWSGIDEKRLIISRDLKRKIAQFPVSDPEVVRLAGTSGMASRLLYTLMCEHINSGKRTKRLTSRNPENAITKDCAEETIVDSVHDHDDENASAAA